MSPLAQGYRRVFGGAQSPVQLYGGFVAFFAGCAMGLIGILIAVSGGLFIEEPWQRYKTGILIAALGMPLLFMGLQLTLPSRFVIHVLAGLGALVCLLGVYLFHQAWPYQWGVRAEIDRSAQTIGVYTLGLVLLVTTTGLALVVNFVSRIVALSSQEDAYDVLADHQRPVTMEEVLRDIEREVNRQRLTWGGMFEEDRLPREYVKLKADFGPGATIYHGSPGKVTKTAAKEMEVAFESLARLRGIEGRQVLGEDDTQVAIDALRALRKARRAKLESSFWYRCRRALVSLLTGGRARQDEERPAARQERPPSASVPSSSQERDERNYPKVERGTSTSPPAAVPARRPIVLTQTTGPSDHRETRTNGHHKGPVRVFVHKVPRRTGPRRPYKQ